MVTCQLCSYPVIRQIGEVFYRAAASPFRPPGTPRMPCKATTLAVQGDCHLTLVSRDDPDRHDPNRHAELPHQNVSQNLYRPSITEQSARIRPQLLWRRQVLEWSDGPLPPSKPPATAAPSCPRRVGAVGSVPGRSLTRPRPRATIAWSRGRSPGRRMAGRLLRLRVLTRGLMQTEPLPKGA